MCCHWTKNATRKPRAADEKKNNTMKAIHLNFEAYRSHFLQKKDGSYAKARTLEQFVEWRSSIGYDTEVEEVKESKNANFRLKLVR